MIGVSIFEQPVAQIFEHPTFVMYFLPKCCGVLSLACKIFSGNCFCCCCRSLELMLV